MIFGFSRKLELSHIVPKFTYRAHSMKRKISVRTLPLDGISPHVRIKWTLRLIQLANKKDVRKGTCVSNHFGHRYFTFLFLSVTFSVRWSFARSQEEWLQWRRNGKRIVRIKIYGGNERRREKRRWVRLMSFDGFWTVRCNTCNRFVAAWSQLWSRRHNGSDVNLTTRNRVLILSTTWD